MGFSNKHHIIFILMLISYYYQIITAQAEERTPVYLARKFCLGGNYTANSTYRNNLNILLSSLSTTFTNNTNPQQGYRNITIGRNPNMVYGSLHCREDILPGICSVCVQIATERVLQDSWCSNSKTAIVFYNGCVLRYSDENYFSILDEKPSIVLTYQDISSITNQVQYTNIVTELLDDLAIEVVTNTSISPSLYASHSANNTRFNRVYAMVHCTPKLTPSLCNKCLISALGRLPSDAGGESVLFSSCDFRFEYNPFYGNYMSTLQASNPTIQSSGNTTTTDSNGKVSSKLVISIAIPLAAAILLSSMAVWWFCFHKKKKINNNDFVPNADSDIQSAESLRFHFNILSAATNNFSEDNKLGEGGFGPVYKVHIMIHAIQLDFKFS
ncbi:hypothetical protein MKW94_028633 [Papaver nudicaule]|uniref:Gnk2-homologous domain-containing protein n=1 Tax=Papaver nudicaule TaxID=74823 RepID=A0AA41VDE7_PAPNU|nr:hypothetical protein [Papaver nudicaule]